jgi:hypothetical protein
MWESLLRQLILTPSGHFLPGALTGTDWNSKSLSCFNRCASTPPDQVARDPSQIAAALIGSYITD